ncbi:hypothetical protein MPSEU_000689700 [Mayamaea pseudoterrestris]|nr:hypothetical protein MPSEU_000689700 [Mayamaea pseudoterrestris]
MEDANSRRMSSNGMEEDYDETDYPADELPATISPHADEEQVPSTCMNDIGTTSVNEHSPTASDFKHQGHDILADETMEKPGLPLDTARTSFDKHRDVDDDTVSLHENDTVEQIIRNQSPTHSVRMALTYLLFLLVPACILTLFALPAAYHLVLGTFWLFIFLLFASLVWFIQTDVIHRRALHPYIHAAYDAVVSEYRSFVGDWREHVLMLTNHDANASDANEPIANDDDDALKQRRKRPKIKSKMFKIMVKPLLPLLKRRRRKSKKEAATTDASVQEEGYVPAPDGSALV